MCTHHKAHTGTLAHTRSDERAAGTLRITAELSTEAGFLTGKRSGLRHTVCRHLMWNTAMCKVSETGEERAAGTRGVPPVTQSFSKY